MSRFYKLLFTMLLLFAGVTTHSQEQQIGRDDYHETRTIRWSEWNKTQPINTQGSNQSAYEIKSTSKSNEGGFLTSEEMKYLLSDEQTEVPKTKKSKPSSAKKNVPDDKSKISVKSTDVQEKQLSSLPTTPQLPSKNPPESSGEYILLGIAAASAFLLLQIVIVFIVWRILVRFQKVPSGSLDTELDSIRKQFNLEKQSLHDEIRSLRMSSDELIRREQEKTSALLLEIDKMNSVISNMPSVPNSELEALRTQFYINNESPQDEIVLSHQKSEEVVIAERKKNRLLHLEIERLNASLASKAAETSSKLQLLRGQMEQETKLLQDRLEELNIRNDELLRSERAKNYALHEEIERLRLALYEKSTAPTPTNSLIDDSVLDKILSMQSDGFMKR